MITEQQKSYINPQLLEKTAYWLGGLSWDAYATSLKTILLSGSLLLSFFFSFSTAPAAVEEQQKPYYGN